MMASVSDAFREQGFEFIETHISWVFLGRDEVFKVKRPVNLGFLDFSTLEGRRSACEAEVKLNRRLAADVYLGVVPVTVDLQGRHHFGGTGEVVDWAVHMKRLPDEQRADVLVEENELTVADVDRLASLLVTFHADAKCDEVTSQYGATAAIRTNVTENFEQTRKSIADYLTDDQAREIEKWQLRFLDKRDVFETRVKMGRIRDGHGDLRLEHVYFRPDETIVILDCIEFSDRFRYADTCSDIAFLSMDLAWRGELELAERLLSRYALESNDYDLYSVVDFYESYRAFVRGKIATFLASDHAVSAPVRERAKRQARQYFLLALAFERPPLVDPVVVAVGGMPGSGKSTVAEAIARIGGVPVVSSDRTRKHLLGLRATDSATSAAWSGAYANPFTQEVYRELFRRVDVVLTSKRSVIIDASFRTRQMRAEAQKLARAHGTRFVMIECKPDLAVCRARLSARQGQASQVSDARVDLLDEFISQSDPIDELSIEQHAVIDTVRPLEENLKKLRQVLPATLA